MAGNTGLRAGELASLTIGSFDLDADPPTITVEAAYSKRRRRDVLPLRSDLAVLLRPYLSSVKGNAFSVCQNRRGAELELQADTSRANATDAKLWPGTWADVLRQDAAPRFASGPCGVD